jgi:ABC-type amino acid transport substrate-binding protein
MRRVVNGGDHCQLKPSNMARTENLTETMKHQSTEYQTVSSRMFFAITLACLTFASMAAAQTPGTTKPLRVGVSPVFPPMVFKQGKEIVGVEADLARALGQELGREIVFVELPWKDQVEALNDGRTDIIMSSMSITMARRYVVAFSKPYFLVGQMGLVRRENVSDYLMGYPINPKGTVGVLKATTGEFLVQREFPKAKLKVFDSGDEAARALIKKKVDLVISDSTLVWYLAGIHAADGVAAVPKPLSEEQLAWAVRKTDEALLAGVNEFVTKASQDGTLLKVFRRWTAVGN